MYYIICGINMLFFVHMHPKFKSPSLQKGVPSIERQRRVERISDLKKATLKKSNPLSIILRVTKAHTIIGVQEQLQMGMNCCYLLYNLVHQTSQLFLLAETRSCMQMVEDGKHSLRDHLYCMYHHQYEDSNFLNYKQGKNID